MRPRSRKLFLVAKFLIAKILVANILVANFLVANILVAHFLVMLVLTRASIATEVERFQLPGMAFLPGVPILRAEKPAGSEEVGAFANPEPANVCWVLG